MDGTSIRRASAADLTAIRQLIDDAYTKYIERIGRPPAPMTADYLLLETIAVAPGAQGSGYGRLLLDRAECDAAELGLTEVRLYTNEAMTENLTFYPRHGYRETGRAVQDGYRRVYFSKTVRG